MRLLRFRTRDLANSGTSTRRPFPVLAHLDGLSTWISSSATTSVMARWSVILRCSSSLTRSISVRPWGILLQSPSGGPPYN